MGQMHMAAWASSSLDASAGNVTLPFVAETLFRAANNQVQLNEDWDIVSAFLGGVGLVRGRFNSAGLRIRGYPQIRPIKLTTLGGTLPAIYDTRDMPLRVAAQENLTLEVTNAAAAAVLATVWFTRPGSPMNVNTRNLRWVRFTAAPTSVAFGWSAAYNITLDDTLEAGNYRVYGMHAWEATLLAARLIFNNEVVRPGCLATQLGTDIPASILDAGLGEWGAFNSITPPMIEVMANAAAAITVTGFLLIGK